MNRDIFLFSLVLLPWAADYLESGRFPSTIQEASAEILLSAFIAAGVFAVVRLRGTVAGKSSEIRRLSLIDPLTGLGNTRALQESLIREIARTRRVSRPLSCLLMDLDDFRMLNDQYGHEKGDAVLQVAARTILSVVRQDVDRVFRYGGDEYLVILPEANTEKALAVAQRLRAAFIALQPPLIPKRTLPVSIALAELYTEQRGEDLLRSLDRAMVKAKGQGKNMIYDARLLET